MKVTRTVEVGSSTVTVSVKGSRSQISRFDWGNPINLRDGDEDDDLTGPEFCGDPTCPDCGTHVVEEALEVVAEYSLYLKDMISLILEGAAVLSEVKSIDERTRQAVGYAERFTDILMHGAAEVEMNQAEAEAAHAEHLRFFASIGLLPDPSDPGAMG